MRTSLTPLPNLMRVHSPFSNQSESLSCDAPRTIFRLESDFLPVFGHWDYGADRKHLAKRGQHTGFFRDKIRVLTPAHLAMIWVRRGWFYPDLPSALLKAFALQEALCAF